MPIGIGGSRRSISISLTFSSVFLGDEPIGECIWRNEMNHTAHTSMWWGEVCAESLINWPVYWVRANTLINIIFLSMSRAIARGSNSPLCWWNKHYFYCQNVAHAAYFFLLLVLWLCCVCYSFFCVLFLLVGFKFRCTYLYLLFIYPLGTYMKSVWWTHWK